jgi:hypothetical protein
VRSTRRHCPCCSRGLHSTIPATQRLPALSRIVLGHFL